jgi:hypothetical protein
MNAPERDTTTGTPFSASSESYRKRRQGNLLRGSDGFRSPELARPMRFPPQEGYRPDEPLEAYKYNPASLPGAPFPNKPNTHMFFRAPELGAPRVGFPDKARTDGKLQYSGEAWGKFGDPTRPVLTPATDGQNGPPSHELGKFTPAPAFSSGPRWTKPEAAKRSDHLAH